MKEKIVREEYSFILVDDVKAVVEKLVPHTYKLYVDLTDGEIYIYSRKTITPKLKCIGEIEIRELKLKKHVNLITKEIKHYFNDRKELLGTKTIYYLGNIKNSMVAKNLFENYYIKIDDKTFYCPNDLKHNDNINYFMEDVKWTKSYMESLNKRLKAVGMPQLIISDGYVYKDELHKLLGIGVKLEEEAQA